MKRKGTYQPLTRFEKVADEWTLEKDARLIYITLRPKSRRFGVFLRKNYKNKRLTRDLTMTLRKGNVYSKTIITAATDIILVRRRQMLSVFNALHLSFDIFISISAKKAFFVRKKWEKARDRVIVVKPIHYIIVF